MRRALEVLGRGAAGGPTALLERAPSPDDVWVSGALEKRMKRFDRWEQRHVTLYRHDGEWEVRDCARARSSLS